MSSTVVGGTAAGARTRSDHTGARGLRRRTARSAARRAHGGGFLRLAIGIAGALGKAHQRGLVHKDLRPSHILVNCADGQMRLTGFGIASRLPRERQTLEAPETITGVLASACRWKCDPCLQGLIIDDAAAAPFDS